MTVRFLVSGVNGVVGSALVAELARAAPTAEIVGVFRADSSYDEFVATAEGDVAAQVRPLFVDLADEGAVATAARNTRTAEHTVAVHCAADVAWHHSRERMWAPNVVGTRNFCRLARDTSDRARLVYVSTAYTRPHDWEYRNAYEETKGIADRVAREEFPDLRPVTFSCSLVVGRTSDGAIHRFHGLYPLFHVLHRLEPPFLVGGRSTRIDVVPVDWVTSELATLVQRVAAGDAAPTFPEMLRFAVTALNDWRRHRGGSQLADVPVISFRQWGFLRRSLDTWEVQGINRAPIGILERLLRSYGPYLADDRVLPPTGVHSPAPDPAAYLPTVIRFWLDHQQRPVEAVS